jgi:hypothetical protein
MQKIFKSILYADKVAKSLFLLIEISFERFSHSFLYKIFQRKTKMANYEDLDAYIQDLEDEIRRKEQGLNEQTRKDMTPSRFVQRKNYNLVLQLIRNYDLKQRAFWNSFRMSHRQFEIILNRIRNDLTLSAAYSLKAEEQLGLFLLMVGQGNFL